MTNKWPGAVFTIALALLTLTISFCLFDGHDPGVSHHGASPDLCIGLLAVSFAVALLGLVATDRLPVDPRPPVYAVSLRRRDPPPKRSSIS